MLMPSIEGSTASDESSDWSTCAATGSGSGSSFASASSSISPGSSSALATSRASFSVSIIAASYSASSIGGRSSPLSATARDADFLVFTFFLPAFDATVFLAAFASGFFNFAIQSFQVYNPPIGTLSSVLGIIS